MKNDFRYLILSAVALLFVLSCSKDDNVDISVEEYKNGKIEFTYPITKANGTIDTTLTFTSRGLNIPELNDYGYFDPSIDWSMLLRLNPDNFVNRTAIFFSGTDLNTLSLPYTFNPKEYNRNAQINYVIDYQTTTDESGQSMSVSNTYAATTNSDSFEVTILSKVNNRLKGTFKGKIQNQDGDIINVKNGIFDVQIVEK